MNRIVLNQNTIQYNTKQNNTKSLIQQIYVCMGKIINKIRLYKDCSMSHSDYRQKTSLLHMAQMQIPSPKSIQYNHPFDLEFRIAMKPLLKLRKRYLLDKYSNIEYDETRNMLIIVNSVEAKNRNNELPAFMFPKILQTEDREELITSGISDVFYPCTRDLTYLYPDEKETLYQLSKDMQLAGCFIDNGTWYQVYRFPVYTNVPVIPDETCPCLRPVKYPGIVTRPPDENDCMGYIKQFQTYTWLIVWTFLYSICTKGAIL